MAGREIDGGMIYAGRSLKAVNGYGTEPALIDPTLPVNWRNPDTRGDLMTYWPSYSSIEPESRAAYLQWLAGGRSAPNVGLGYVFLFFYGLERRVLTDGAIDPADPDVVSAVVEVERLVRLYGDRGSFGRYARSFLELVQAGRTAHGEIAPSDVPDSPVSWELPLALRIAIARFAADHRPLPAEWGLAWLRTDPRAYLRTPAKRCLDEFDSLFLERYRERFPSGLELAPTRGRIELAYHPASAGFGGRIEATVGDLPDVTASETTFAKLREVAEGCSDELDSYSRYVGRYPDSDGSPEAVALLPRQLLRSHGGRTVQAVADWANDLLKDGDFATASIEDLVATWSPALVGEKLGKAQVVSLASLLAKLGFGMEPDVRFGAPKPKPGENVMLFRLGADAPSAPSPGYTDAALLVRLCGLLAAADGTVSERERRLLVEHLEESVGLEAAERARVEASLLWVGATGQQFGGLKKRVEVLALPERATLGHFLTAVAAADGEVSPEEITALTKLYRILGLEEAAVYSAVHALGAGGDAPVTVRAADRDTGRRAIPPDPDDGGVRIDQARLSARRTETAEVAALLGSVFAEDDAPAGTPFAPPQPAEGGASIAGLDARHAALAQAMASRSTWAPADLEQLAADYSIPLVDAAIDRINDALFEVCGEPLLEGDGPWEVNAYALEEVA